MCIRSGYRHYTLVVHTRSYLVSIVMRLSNSRHLPISPPAKWTSQTPMLPKTRSKAFHQTFTTTHQPINNTSHHHSYSSADNYLFTIINASYNLPQHFSYILRSSSFIIFAHTTTNDASSNDTSNRRPIHTTGSAKPSCQ